MAGSIENPAGEIGIAAVNQIRVFIGFDSCKRNFLDGFEGLFQTFPYRAADQIPSVRRDGGVGTFLFKNP